MSDDSTTISLALYEAQHIELGVALCDKVAKA